MEFLKNKKNPLYREVLISKLWLDFCFCFYGKLRNFIFLIWPYIVFSYKENGGFTPLHHMWIGFQKSGPTHMFRMVCHAIRQRATLIPNKSLPFRATPKYTDVKVFPLVRAFRIRSLPFNKAKFMLLSRAASSNFSFSNPNRFQANSICIPSSLDIFICCEVNPNYVFSFPTFEDFEYIWWLPIVTIWFFFLWWIWWFFRGFWKFDWFWSKPFDWYHDHLIMSFLFLFLSFWWWIVYKFSGWCSIQDHTILTFSLDHFQFGIQMDGWKWKRHRSCIRFLESEFVTFKIISLLQFVSSDHPIIRLKVLYC